MCDLATFAILKTTGQHVTRVCDLSLLCCHRIPPNATLVYEVQLISLPGKEGDLFDALGDE